MPHLDYNVGGIFDAKGNWMSFLAGGLILISFMLGIAETYEIYVMVYLAFLVAGIFIFLNALMRGDEVVYFSQNLISLAIGMVMAVYFGFTGYGTVFFIVILALTIITYFLKYGKMLISRK